MTRSIEDRLEQGFAPGWRPEAGDQIVGTIVDISEGEGDYGPYPIVTIETADGDLAVHAFHTVLRKELAAKRPVEGDRVGIKYLGIPAGKKYEAYRVALERATPRAGGPDWGAVGARADQELAQQGATVTPAAAASSAAWDGEEPF